MKIIFGLELDACAKLKTDNICRPAKRSRSIASENANAVLSKFPGQTFNRCEQQLSEPDCKKRESSKYQSLQKWTNSSHMILL